MSRGRSSRRRHPDRVPLGRTVIVAVFVAAIAFLGYSWYQDGVRPPFTSTTFVLNAQIVDAAGLAVDNEPVVSVAGIPVGRVVAVRTEGGMAKVTMRLEQRARGRVFADAVVRVRPQNGTNVLGVDIRPGTPAAGALPADATIPASRSRSPVSPSEALSTLDADTQAFLTVVLSEAGQGLDGRGGDLSQALRSVAKAMDPASEIASTLSRRRTLVSDLIGEVDVIFETLARRRQQLRTMVRSSQTILATTASQDRQVATALRAAPRVLDQAQQTMAVADDVAPRFSRSFDAMLPVTRKLGPSMRALRSLLPAVSRLLTATDRYATTSAEPVADATKVAHELERAKAALELAASGVDAITGIVAAEKDRIPVVAPMIAGMFGQQDDRSVLGRVLVENIEDPKPQNFGLPDTPAGRRALRRELPRAMKPMCGDLAARCAELVLRARVPEDSRLAGRP